MAPRVAKPVFDLMNCYFRQRETERKLRKSKAKYKWWEVTSSSMGGAYKYLDRIVFIFLKKTCLVSKGLIFWILFSSIMVWFILF